MRTQRQCIFCGNPANSREHAIPKWISRQLGIKDFMAPEDALLRGVKPRKQPISFASYRKKIFCRGCNKHFKHLEDAVIPLIVPMAKGKTNVALSPESQGLLALWAGKTAAALIALVPELSEIVPIDHRRAIRNDGRLSENVWVGYFPWRASGPVLSTGSGLAVSNVNPTDRRETYGALLAFAKIGFYVVGLSGDLRSGEVLDGSRPPFIHVWPPKSRVVAWPPPYNAVEPGDRLASVLSFVPLCTAPRGG